MNTKFQNYFSLISFPILVSSLFLLLSINNIVHHEMWRDEIQAWLIARDSSSLTDLFLHNLRYEGHPGLWHLGLFTITKFTQNPIAMQYFHVFISTISIYLFTKYSPFTYLQKFLFSFGYFSFFEYTVISRNYTLGVLLLFLVATLLCFPKSSRKYIEIFLVLGFLANVSAYSFIIANVIVSVLFFEKFIYDRLHIFQCHEEYFMERSKDEKKTTEWIYFWIGLSIFLGLSLASILQILPPSDTGFRTEWYLYFDLDRLGSILKILYKAMVPIPALGFGFWNDYIVGTTAQLILFIPLLYLSILCLIRKPIPLFIYCLGLINILVFSYLKNIGSARHHGHIFILFITCLWIAEYYPKSTLYKGVIQTFSFSFSTQRQLLTSLLVIHVIAGVFAVSMDLKHPFSMTYEASNFLEGYLQHDVLIAGYPDTTTAAFSAYLNQNIYYPNHDRMGSFVIWDNQRTELSQEKILSNVESMMANQNRTHCILALTSPLKQISRYPSLSKLKMFKKSLSEENIYLYLIRTSA